MGLSAAHLGKIFHPINLKILRASILDMIGTDRWTNGHYQSVMWLRQRGSFNNSVGIKFKLTTSFNNAVLSNLPLCCLKTFSQDMILSKSTPILQTIAGYYSKQQRHFMMIMHMYNKMSKISPKVSHTKMLRVPLSKES